MERVYGARLLAAGINYAAMKRIQQANMKFDPTVARYLEALLKNGGSDVTSGTGTRGGSTSMNNDSQEEYVGQDVTETVHRYHDDPRQDKETLQFVGRTRETTKNGSVTERTVGDAEKNFTKDGPGSQDKTGHIVSTSTTTKKSGKFISKDDEMRADRQNRAAKATPMSATPVAKVSGATGPDGSADGAFAKVANGQMGPQTWNSATSMDEMGSQAGTSRVHEEGYEGDNTVIQTDGQATANYDTTEYGRNQLTGTDLSRTTTYDGFSDKVTDGGQEIRNSDAGKRTGGHEDTVKSTRAPRKTSGSGSTSMNEETSHSDTVNRTGWSWNRYTGRDGMTPQEAFRTALDYLQQYPNALAWLFEQLDHCFIGTLEVEI